MTAKKLFSLQFSGAAWFITSFHTMYNLLKSKPSAIAAICSYMKVAISASTEAFLSQKSKKKKNNNNNNNINKMYTY